MKSRPAIDLDQFDRLDLEKASELLFEIEEAGELRASHAQHLGYISMLCASLLNRFEVEHGPVHELTPEELSDEEPDDKETV